MDGRDGARIIPLTGGRSAGALARARRLAARRNHPSSGAVTEASIHQLGVSVDVAEPAPVAPAGDTPRAEAALEFARRRAAGDYAVDEFGFDADLTDSVFLPLLGPLYERWFRVEVNGVDHLPLTGGALLVANHAGGLWALDALMTVTAVRREHPRGRHLRLLSADLVFRTPVFGTLARKLGVTNACAEDAQRLLADGELVGVFPEGFAGIGKRFRDRYNLQRFGRGGFVHAAIRAGVPIVPVSIIGAEEIHPVVRTVPTLARVLNLPYFPLTPTFPWLGPLGLVPLPSKWYIEFGEPIATDRLGPDAADYAVTVFETTDRVRETIQSTLHRLLGQRRSVWR